MVSQEDLHVQKSVQWVTCGLPVCRSSFSPPSECWKKKSCIKPRLSVENKASHSHVLLMKQFRSGLSVGFCQVARAGSVLINNIRRPIQAYANGLGLETGRKDTKGLALTFHMQSRARVSAAQPLDRKHQRFPQARRRIIAQKQAH